MARGIAADTERYAADLLADVNEHAQIEGQEAFLAEAFSDLVLSDLEDDGLWPDYQLAYLARKGIQVNAWGLDELSRTLYLAVTDFVYESEARTISNTDRHAVLKRVVNLVESPFGIDRLRTTAPSSIFCSRLRNLAFTTLPLLPAHEQSQQWRAAEG